MRRLLIAAVLLAGCDAYDEDLGPAPFCCGAAEPRCPNNYYCAEDPASGDEVCLPNDDSFDKNFTCNDDSTMEPNDSLDTAAMTSIDTSSTFSADKGAICPAADKDNYALTITGTKSVELTVMFQANGAPLYAAILNTGGVPLAEGMASGAEPTTLHAVASNLTAGAYYVRVQAMPTGPREVNNYKLSVDVTP